MKKWQYKRIKDIMKYFDFQKVHKVMKLLNWDWAPSTGIPSVAEIKDNARAKLVKAVTEGNDTDCYCTSGGGLHVEYSKKYKRLDLFFCIEESFD